jgi:uncharacterized protein (TIGR02117 family)
LQPVAVEHTPETTPFRYHSVYVDSHGWHTGFILPADAVSNALPFLSERFTDHPAYFEFGWGDKGFYQSHEVTTGLTLRAMFWSAGSVMHVVAVPVSPHSYFPDSQLEELKLSDNELHDLVAFLSRSFARDASNNPIALQQGLYGDSQFYQAVGDYFILNTCNKWTAKGLKSAGRDIATPFKLTAGSVMEYLKSQTPQKTVP